MAIPEHVKRQAMDAVSHRETTAQIRAFQGSGSPASPRDSFTHSEPAAPAEPAKPEARVISDDAKRQAMDAVSHRETTAQIRLVRDNGSVTVPVTPVRDTDRIAGKIAQMHKAGQDVDSTHRSMTQDNFGRE